jgi:putative hydrolase of the HAD superfamily
MPIRAVLFDLGGTLVHYHDPENNDPQRPFRRVTMVGVLAVTEKLTAQGVKLPGRDVIAAMLDKHIGNEYRDALTTLRGGSLEKPVRSALTELGVSVDDAQWADLRAVLYAPMDGILSARIGCREVLKTLTDQGYKIALISNTYWSSDLHDRHIAEFQLMDFLPVRAYSCDEPYQKPHPEIFKRTLERIGIQPAESIYVGDRIDVDILGAHRAGMKGVLIQSPYLETDHTPKGEAQEMIPDATIAELPELPTVVNRFK